MPDLRSDAAQHVRFGGSRRVPPLALSGVRYRAPQFPLRLGDRWSAQARYSKKQDAQSPWKPPHARDGPAEDGLWFGALISVKSR